MKAVEIRQAEKDEALGALDVLRALVEDGTITELAAVGQNARGEVTAVYTFISRPFTIVGALKVLSDALALRHCEVLKNAARETD